jgi:hypothetical protein
MPSKASSIKIKDTTKHRLKGFGQYGDTLDGIINKLCDELDKYRKWYGRV